VEEVNGGDFETGRPDSVKGVVELHFDFLGECGFEWVGKGPRGY
jgi:hypothetical protein